MSPGSRRARPGERGLTLIELIVTMALLTLGVLAMLGLFSTIVIALRSTDSSGQMATQLRQVQDYIEQSVNLQYIPCGTAAAYDTALQGALPSIGVPASYSVHVVGLQQASSGSHTVGGVAGLAISPIYVCAGSPSPDYGVQQLELRIVDTSGHSLQRLAYKRWNLRPPPG